MEFDDEQLRDYYENSVALARVTGENDVAQRALGANKSSIDQMYDRGNPTAGWSWFDLAPVVAAAAVAPGLPLATVPHDESLARVMRVQVDRRVAIAAAVRERCRPNEWGHVEFPAAAGLRALARFSAAVYVESTYSTHDRRPTPWTHFRDRGADVVDDLFDPPLAANPYEKHEALRDGPADPRNVRPRLHFLHGGRRETVSPDGLGRHGAAAESWILRNALNSALRSGGQESWPMFWLRQFVREPRRHWTDVLTSWAAGATYSGFPQGGDRITIARGLPCLSAVFSAINSTWLAYLDGVIDAADEMVDVAVPVSSVNSLNYSLGTFWVGAAIVTAFEVRFTPTRKTIGPRRYGTRGDLVHSGPGVLVGTVPAWALWAFSGHDQPVNAPARRRTNREHAALAKELAALVDQAGDFSDRAAAALVLSRHFRSLPGR